MKGFASSIVLILLTLPSLVVNDSNHCRDKLTIYGPGWDDIELILPSRYFFIQSPPECATLIQQVSITSLDGSHRGCQLRQELLNDTQTGSLIVRYRIIEPVCKNGLKISLLSGERQVIASQEYDGFVYGEKCSCQLTDFSERMKCHESTEIYNQINRDLQSFNASSSFDSWLKDAIDRFAQYPRSYSFCHYQIKSNHLYRKCYGEYVDFSQFFDSIFLSILRKTQLPDTEFLVNLGDWPLSSTSQSPIPIFSWCGSDDTYDIVLPTYEMTESVIEMQDRVSVDVLALMGRQVKSWSEKQDKLFWRGRDSNLKRLILRTYSKENPDLIDAAITNFFFFRSDEEVAKYGPRTPHVSFFDYGQYKYLANIDGTVAAYRLPFLLAINSLVVKQSSKYYEHFYHLIEPFKHFLPVKEDLSDVHVLLSRLTNSSDPSFISPKQQMQIIGETRRFVNQYLLPHHIYCYYYRALTEYSKLVPGLSTPLNSEQIKSNGDCTCNQSIQHEEL